MQHIVVLRFSAMGDVLMTLPVIDSMARQYPNVRLTVVSRPWAKPIFELLPSNVIFLEADLKGKYAGYHGVNLLARRLMALHPTHVADLHDVLRTRWLRIRFSVAGMMVRHIRKNRYARMKFITAEVKTPQVTAFEKYADVFHRLGFKDLHVDFQSLFPKGGADLSTALPHFDTALRPEQYWVGIAPFAAHEGKIYPKEQMEEVIRQLDSRGDIRMFLFGAGKAESAILEEWANRYPHAENMSGKLNDMGEELALISHCRVMLSMDSGNMHLASLAAVPVLSIWGATHPLGGFMGYGQDIDNALQCSDLPCRPCSTYGNKECQFGDYRCMTRIKPEQVVSKMMEVLTNRG